MIGTYLMNTLPCNSPNNHIRKSTGGQETYLVLQNIAFAYKQQLKMISWIYYSVMRISARYVHTHTVACTIQILR